MVYSSQLIISLSNKNLNPFIVFHRISYMFSLPGAPSPLLPEPGIQ